MDICQTQTQFTELLKARRAQLLNELAQLDLLIQQTARQEARNDNKLLNITQAAKKIGVSRSTLYRMVNTGQIKPLMILGQPRFTTAALDTFLQS